MTRSRWARAARPITACLITVVVASCAHRASPPTDTSTEVSVGERDLTYARSILDNLSDIEFATLSDGLVTDAELVSAKEDLRACLEGNSFVVEDREFWSAPSDLSSLASESAEHSTESLERIDLECRERTDAVEHIWFLQNAPTAEEVERARDNFAACIASESGFVASYEEAVEVYYSAGPDEHNETCAADLERRATTPLPGLEIAWEKARGEIVE